MLSRKQIEDNDIKSLIFLSTQMVFQIDSIYISTLFTANFFSINYIELFPQEWVKLISFCF